MKLAKKLGIFAASTLLMALASTQVRAQEPPPIGDGFPPPPEGQGQFGGPQGPPGRRQRGAMPLTAAIVPASALTAYLNLSPEKSARLVQIVEQLRAARPRPGGDRQMATGTEGSPAAMPTREEMQAARPKFDAAIAQANQQIVSLLDDRQAKRLAILMKVFQALQSDSISLNAAARLRLSDKQIEALAALGSSPSRAAVTESFTAEQREVADLNRTQARRGPPGGGPGGGPGFGPPGGGPGFGPPGGGPDGPPEGGPGVGDGPPDGPPPF